MQAMHANYLPRLLVLSLPQPSNCIAGTEFSAQLLKIRLAEKAVESILPTVLGLLGRRMIAQSLMRRGSYQIDRRHPHHAGLHELWRVQGKWWGSKLAGATLSRPRELHISKERINAKQTAKGK